MFANVEIITDVKGNTVSVPQSAVLDDGGKKIVFIADGKNYAQRQVQLGIQSGDRLEIIDGLNAGDRVVTKGNYLLLQKAKPDQ
jgi:Cu(I)/Ag(I) efflux system membrane fusion protein